MDQVNLLREALRPHLAWQGARLSFLAAFLIALLRVKTINLAELATAFGGKAQTDSHYKRLQRFFRDYELDYAEVTQAVVNLMEIPEPWEFSLDRTEWQFGAVCPSPAWTINSSTGQTTTVGSVGLHCGFAPKRWFLASGCNPKSTSNDHR